MTRYLYGAGCAGLLMLAAAAMIFFFAPEDALQHEGQRIFYLHVSSAIAAFASFAVVLVGSVMYLWRESIAGDTLARAAALVGVVFTTEMLATFLFTLACTLVLATVMIAIRYRIETLLDARPVGEMVAAPHAEPAL